MSSTENTTNPTTANPAVSMVKDHSSEIALLTTIVKDHDAKFADLTKSQTDILAGIAKLGEQLVKKAEDKNPVTSGVTAELKPAVTSPTDVGASTEGTTGYAPTGNAQASIVAPAGEASGTGTVAKADDKKEDEDEKPEMKKSTEMKKSAPDGYEYEIVKAIRPKTGLLPQTPNGAPTGYEVLQAINKGWGGKHTNYEQSFIEGWTRLLKGEFGSGLPGMGVV